MVKLVLTKKNLKEIKAGLKFSCAEKESGKAKAATIKAVTYGPNNVIWILAKLGKQEVNFPFQEGSSITLID